MRLRSRSLLLLAALCGAASPGLAVPDGVAASAGTSVKTTSLRTCFRVHDAIAPQVEANIASVRDEVKRQRAAGHLIAYLSTPIGGRGGGYTPLNLQISKFLGTALTKRYGPRLWVLTPDSPKKLESVGDAEPDDGDYMYMWTQILAGDAGQGTPFDLLAIAGPSDFRNFFGHPELPALAAVEKRLQALQVSDAEFRKRTSTPEAFREALSYYGLRASGAMSLGSHDEWNIFAKMNQQRRESNDDQGLHQTYRQIPVLYDGRSLSTSELEKTVSPGFEVPCSSGPLDKLDAAFLSAYVERRGIVKAATSPVIVVSGSDLILFRNGSREQKRVIPDVYHALKAVSHLPFAVYLTLSPVPDGGALPPSVKAELASIQGRIAEAGVTSVGFSAAQLARVREILDGTSSFIRATLESGRFDRRALSDYAAAMGPKMLANAYDAGCAQIQATHRQVTSWKTAMTSDEWNRLIVMNRGKHQARYRNAATQYFAWALGQASPPGFYPGESKRVVYSEFLSPEEDSRDLMSTVLIDSDASAAFFHDPWRLTTDILADGARSCVAALGGTEARREDASGSFWSLPVLLLIAFVVLVFLTIWASTVPRRIRDLENQLDFNEEGSLSVRRRELEFLFKQRQTHFNKRRDYEWRSYFAIIFFFGAADAAVLTNHLELGSWKLEWAGMCLAVGILAAFFEQGLRSRNELDRFAMDRLYNRLCDLIRVRPLSPIRERLKVDLPRGWSSVSRMGLLTVVVLASMALPFVMEGGSRAHCSGDSACCCVARP